MSLVGLLVNSKRKMRHFWQRYSRNKSAVVSVPFISFIILLAIFASWIAPYDPLEFHEESFSRPSAKHFLGTDDLGRDIFSGIVYGSRVSLTVGFLAAFVSVMIGTVVGAISGFFGGTIDHILMRLTDVFMILPGIVITLVVIAMFGSSVMNVILVIGVISWPIVARLVRSEVLSLKEQDFVLAAKAMGLNSAGLIFSEILPNATTPIIVSATLQAARAIIIEAGLSFLGLGDPTLMSWGRMIGNAQSFLRIAWWMAVFPGIAIFVTVLSLNVIGDGLNDALNPRLREGHR